MDSAPAPSVAGLKPGLKVMISAGAAGIGRAFAETFAEHGAKVHVCDVSREALDECLAALPGVEGMIADVSDQAQVDRWFDAAQAHLGGLDVMINNAGVAGPTGPIEELDPEAWRHTFDVNVHGMFYCTSRAVPLLKAAEDGVMINLASIAGRFGYPFRTPYSASKWAVVGLTKSLSQELGRFGVRVNALLPGPVEGPRIDRVIDAKARERGVPFETVRDEMVSLVSLGRMVSAQDIANMALLLCSPLARNVSGQAISICGDAVALR